MPVTNAVRKEFKLGTKAAGAVVASVEPGGTGEFYGIEPGDVISQVDDKLIRRPVDIDSMVRYGLNRNESFFKLDGTRNNKRLRTWIALTPEEYEAPVALDKVKSWRAWGGQSASSGWGYFYYPDYCEAYYDTFFHVWDYSHTYIEQVIITEVYITSIESADAVFYFDESATGYDWPDESYITEVESYVYSGEFHEDYFSTQVLYEDEYATEGLVTDIGGETVHEDPAVGNTITEEIPNAEPVYEEPAYEEPAYEEPVYDEPAYEEPAYEEPAYEEPAYEEPAYEEPAYEDGAGGCFYDDAGNETCG